MSDSIKQVVKLASLMTEQAARVAALDEELKAAKEALRRTEREDLPTLMLEIGLTEIKLEDGSVVAIKEEVDVAVSNDNKPAAYKWLIDNGFGGLVKTEVSVAFQRGDRDNAVACAEKLMEAYEGVDVREAVHPSTLKAFVKEQMQEGKPVPMDLFGVFPYSIAKLSTKKRK